VINELSIPNGTETIDFVIRENRVASTPVARYQFIYYRASVKDFNEFSVFLGANRRKGSEIHIPINGRKGSLIHIPILYSICEMEILN